MPRPPAQSASMRQPDAGLHWIAAPSAGVVATSASPPMRAPWAPGMLPEEPLLPQGAPYMPHGGSTVQLLIVVDPVLPSAYSPAMFRGSGAELLAAPQAAGMLLATPLALPSSTGTGVPSPRRATLAGAGFSAGGQPAAGSSAGGQPAPTSTAGAAGPGQQQHQQPPSAAQEHEPIRMELSKRRRKKPEADASLDGTATRVLSSRSRLSTPAAAEAERRAHLTGRARAAQKHQRTAAAGARPQEAGPATAGSAGAAAAAAAAAAAPAVASAPAAAAATAVAVRPWRGGSSRWMQGLLVHVSRHDEGLVWWSETRCRPSWLRLAGGCQAPLPALPPDDVPQAGGGPVSGWGVNKGYGNGSPAAALLVGPAAGVDVLQAHGIAPSPSRSLQDQAGAPAGAGPSDGCSEAEGVRSLQRQKPAAVQR